MRSVNFDPLAPTPRPPKSSTGSSGRCARHENASAEDAISVADSHGANSTYPTTRQLNVTTPTASNIAAVLASFLADLRKRGVKKST
jgi:hypothetical protein